MKTTYIERANTNREVIRRANEQVERENKNKHITTFREFYRKNKHKRLARVINRTNEEIQNVTFRNPNTIEPWIQPNRKKGRPRHKWTDKAIEEMWNDITKQNAEYIGTKYDNTNEHMVTQMKTHVEHLLDKR